MNKIFNYLNNFYQYLKTDKGLSQIALLPVFFSWYAVVLFQYENSFVRRYCLSSLIFTAYFFLFLMLGGIFSKVSNFGSIIANTFHFIGIIIYLLSCGFLIYSIKKEKNMVLLHERKPLAFLEKLLIENERP